MSKKATPPLPYSEDDFKAAQLRVDALREELLKAELLITEMRKKNFTENVIVVHRETFERHLRKDHGMTKAMQVVLEKMREWSDIYMREYSRNRAGTFFVGWDEIPKKLFDHLILAKFIWLKSNLGDVRIYRITDLGILALTGKKINIQEPTK